MHEETVPVRVVVVGAASGAGSEAGLHASRLGYDHAVAAWDPGRITYGSKGFDFFPVNDCRFAVFAFLLLLCFALHGVSLSFSLFNSDIALSVARATMQADSERPKRSPHSANATPEQRVQYEMCAQLLHCNKLQ